MADTAKHDTGEMRALKTSSSNTKILLAAIGLATALVGLLSTKTAHDVTTQSEDVAAVKEQVAVHVKLDEHIKSEKESRLEMQNALKELAEGQKQQGLSQSELKGMLELELQRHGIQRPGPK